MGSLEIEAGVVLWEGLLGSILQQEHMFEMDHLQGSVKGPEAGLMGLGDLVSRLSCQPGCPPQRSLHSLRESPTLRT